MQTALIAAAAPLAGAGALAQTPKKKLGVALCGLGSLSTNQIAPALQKTANCQLTAVVSGDRQKAKQWQTKYNIPDSNVYSYDTIEKMADNPDIDIVYIVTPNAMHMDNALAAAKAGKHVFCEKPLEISVERCQRMIDACKKAEVQLGVAYRCQFEPHHLECIRIAREKELGTIKAIESAFGFAIGDPDQWRLKKELSGGGALMDVGIYVLQATRYLTGEEPVLIAATETKTDRKKFAEVDETMAWTATFPSGAIAYCSTSFNTFGMGSYRAHTERGWFGLNPAFNYGGLKGARSDGKPLQFPQVDQFATEMDEFARCILENKPTTVPGEEGLQDVKILMAIYESARTGKALKIA
jgi:predicted dehydrogenase